MNNSVSQSIFHLPDQIQTALDLALNLNLPESYKSCQNIVVSAMGGSRFPQVVLQELFKEDLKIPFYINNEYRIPGFVNNNTLWIASSYSGTTEEVIMSTKAACDRGAKIIGVAKGGELGEFLKANNLPFVQFDGKFNPAGEPRMGWGYNLGATLGILISVGAAFTAAHGHAQGVPLQIQSAISSLRSLDQRALAKSLATQLRDHYPTFVVSEFLSGCGNEIANQTNETAKNFAEFRVIPELNHHLMEGLKNPASMKKISAFIFFFSKLYSPGVQKRFQITREVVEQNGIKIICHQLKSEDKISQVFEMLQLGSLVTAELADLYGVDPETIPYVDYFKKKMKE